MSKTLKISSLLVFTNPYANVIILHLQFEEMFN